MVQPVFVFDSRERFWPVGVEESLEACGVGLPVAGVARLNFPAKLPSLSALVPVVYHRLARGGGLQWDQFWLWYVHNPWSVAGVGEHEGDWEFVQVGSVDDTPVLVTGSQHHGGGKREAWACERVDGRPVVYVGRGSHANYFAPGAQGGGIDHCDAKGRRLDEYEVRQFGEWASWPGRWGNSTGEGKSPESPAKQGVRWSAPHIFHSSAR